MTTHDHGFGDGMQVIWVAPGRSAECADTGADGVGASAANGDVPERVAVAARNPAVPLPVVPGEASARHEREEEA